MGGYIVIDHNGGVFSLYEHMSRTFVNTGQRVGTGQIVDRQGATGQATGEHVHLAMVADRCLPFDPPLGPALRDPAPYAGPRYGVPAGDPGQLSLLELIQALYESDQTGRTVAGS